VLGGIVIQGAPNNTIGGTAAGAGNLVSGNDADGVLIFGAGASGNRVLGNRIGSDVDGVLDLGNLDTGVQIQDAPNNIVGGATTGSRNLVAGNDGDGVYLFSAMSTGNLVLGNYIGTDLSGSADLGNADDGIQVQDAPNNTIGGTAVGATNLISGNDDDGIVVISPAATGNRIEGNLIGTGAGGITDLGNTSDGVLISNASNNTVGGATAATTTASP
jgi:titin